MFLDSASLELRAFGALLTSFDLIEAEQVEWGIYLPAGSGSTVNTAF